MIDPDDEDQIIACCDTGQFQLWSSRQNYRPDGSPYTIDGALLTFDGNGKRVIDEDLANIIEAIRDGSFVSPDGVTNAKHLQKLALEDNLRVLRPGMLAPPMQTWDALADDEVVGVAEKAGHLPELEHVVYALKYERQAPKRLDGNGRPGKPRERVIHDLERLRQDKSGEVVTDKGNVKAL
jgi:hypothetical protein